MTETSKPANTDDKSATPAPADVIPSTPTRHAADENTASNEAGDVKALLSRHTFDGKGDNAVPPSDFRGYATEGVEKNKLLPLDEVVQHVLNGNFGVNAQTVVERLRAAGYENLDEIEAAYNKRVQAGAPKAF